MKIQLSIISMLFILVMGNVSAKSVNDLSQVRYGVENINGVDLFYREAGDPSKQAVVLLHGFPSSSHQYRELLSNLGDEFYLFAPDYPGFGDSAAPSVKEYKYTFDNLAITMEALLDKRGLDNYVMVIHDFGAPVGLRIASKNPSKIAGLVVMNGNAYEVGLSQMFVDFNKVERSAETEKKRTESILSYEGLKWGYTHGTRNAAGLNPDNWNLDFMKMSRPGTKELNLDLLFDYKNNITQYPVWQKYLRDNQPPTLVVWGKNDPFFPEPGAAAYKKDLKNIDYNILDTGHFPLEEEAPFIISKMRGFLKSAIK